MVELGQAARNDLACEPTSREFSLTWNLPRTKSQVRKTSNTIASRGQQVPWKFAASGAAPSPFYYWPVEPREETVAGFIKAFGQLGYAVCDTSDLEPGYERLAIYADDTNVPTHMARQLPSGHWTSKLGELEDIQHLTLDQLAGSDYGRVVQFLKRKHPTL